MRGFSPGKRLLAVARIERSEIRGRDFDKAPDFARQLLLHCSTSCIPAVVRSMAQASLSTVPVSPSPGYMTNQDIG